MLVSSTSATTPAALDTSQSTPTVTAATPRRCARSRRCRPAGPAAPVGTSQSSPRTIVAVAAICASRQDAAATETVRQGVSAGSPVTGSTMWCSPTPPRRQRRTEVEDVASPPVRIRTAGRSGSAAAASSASRTVQPPGGPPPATATSPPSETSTPQPAAAAASRAARSAAYALAVAPRSSTTPAGTRTVPACRVDLDRPPARHPPDHERSGRLGRHRGEVPVVPEPGQRGAHGRVDRAAGDPGRPQRGLHQREQQRGHPRSAGRRPARPPRSRRGTGRRPRPAARAGR